MSPCLLLYDELLTYAYVSLDPVYLVTCIGSRLHTKTVTFVADAEGASVCENPRKLLGT